MSTSYQDPQWWQAQTLEERIASLRNYHGDRPSSPGEVTSAALNRIAEWRAQSPFQSEEWFARRLQLAGVSEQEFAEILGQPPDILQQRSPEPPQWLVFLIESFSQTRGFPDTVQAPGCYFYPIFSPLLKLATERGKEEIKCFHNLYERVPFDTAEADPFLSTGLAGHLDWVVGRTAVLELKIASLENRLEGATPEARFQSFINGLYQPGTAFKFLHGYPVLGRILAETVSLWIKNRVEFLERLCKDWDLLCTTFLIQPNDALEQLSGGLGDLHSGGRSVLLLQFRSGKKLIYKPRSLSIDEQFSSLLSWLNAKGAPDLYTPQVLPRGSYGWSEFIKAEPCRSKEQLTQFYYRQGSLLALLHALEANDFHRENLLAQGEHPVLIDLESLCRADFGLGDVEIYGSVAAYELTTSVLQVGLLPQPRKSKNGNAVDFSGIGGRGGQHWHVETPAWENAGTDVMRLVRRYHKIAPAQNQPTLSGELVDPLEFSEQIVSGFEGMYHLLLRYRNELLKEGGPISQFEKAEVRAIFRVTQFYAILLNESLHPDVLRDAVDRDRLFDRIWFALERNPLADTALKIIKSEQRDLWQGDIPCFRNPADSLDTYSGQGTLIPGVFIRSGINSVRTRLTRFSEKNLAREKWLIQSSLTAFELEAEGSMPRYVQRYDAHKASVTKLRKEATAIGEHLIQSAFCKDDYASWIGLSLTGNRWILCPLSVDLYSGLPGIALFLGFLGKVEDREIYTDYAKKTLAAVRRQLKKEYQRPKQVGGFEGWGGLIYVWTQLAVLWNDYELLEEANGWLEAIAPLVDVDRNLDVVGGSAGGILALLKFWHKTGSESALKLAIKMGDRLLGQARPFAEGIGWIVPADPDGPLAGFSHGVSGIAYSLLRLKQATGENRFQETALRSLAFENSVFFEHAQNWLDLRGNRDPESPKPKFMTAWCHGAPGIGLSRLRMLRELEEPRFLKDFAAALRSTSATGFGSNHSLCHGDLGNLELFLEGSRTLGDLTCSRELDLRTAQILASIEDAGWLCGVPKGVETPGLMTGLAGIGYGLLRIVATNEVPSVLLMD